MPELAEVEFYRKQWSPGLREEVSRVRLHPGARIFREIRPEALRKALTGKRFSSSHAHGKQLLFRFGTDIWLGLHLGMSGELQCGAPELVPDRHDHLVMVMESCALVFRDPRMFGKVRFHQGDSAPEWWRDLPPQPQEAAFDQKRLRDCLRTHPRMPMKALLLNQQEFPGIGNWMADEILWQAKIHPARKAGELSPHYTKQLFAALKRVSKGALEIIGTSWGDPPADWLFLHRWKRGGTCPVSGKPLVHETIGGRTTCFSPAIQK